MTDKKKHTPMMEQYLSIKAEHKDYLLFYRMGDFYEMFFDDAIKASEALDITLTKRGKELGQDIPMCGVPVANHEIYLSRLIKKGFKIAFCEQMEDPAEAKKRGYNSCVKREVIRIITPGTITEESILNMKRNNYLLCIYPCDNFSYGLAWADISTGEFHCEHITDKRLAEVSSRLCPSEIILPDTLSGNKQVISRLNTDLERLTYLPSSRYSLSGASTFLKELFHIDTLDSFGDFTSDEIIAAGVLADYINLTQKGKMPSLLCPSHIQDGSFMQIDASTRQGLEIFVGHNDKNSSLISKIDATLTGGGGRLLSSRLSAPLLSVKQINDRLDEVDFFVNNKDTRAKIRDILYTSGDMERSMTRISLGRAYPRDLAVIRDTLDKLPVLVSELHFRQDFLPHSLQEIVLSLGNHSALVELLNRALKDELPPTTKDGGFIAKGYSAELDNLHEIRDNSRQLIARLQLKYAQESKVPSLKICHNNIIGYYIEVTSKYASDILEASQKGEMPFIHRQSLSGSVRFTTTELSELEEKITSAAGKAIALEQSIFAELCQKIVASKDKIFEASKALSQIDVATALAEIAERYNYCRPVIDNSCAFEIIKGRHPVVENTSNNHKDFVANDCIMQADGRNCLWLITGPNMAGKSTFLRQNALMAIMAQAGSFIPAEKAHIGIIDKLFSRIGASDNLANGQSTFMVEMVETASILNQATEKSFVILDEIGRGTSTFDGLSIAWAVLESLHNQNKCRGLFATHYHELTALSEVLPHLVLYTMKTKEWKDDIIFMYEIEKGKADRSYGIHVAKLAGLPRAVIKRAEEVLNGLESKKNRIDEILGELPLFSCVSCDTDEKTAEEHEVNRAAATVHEMLLNINADELTPLQALNELYKLVAAAKES